MAIIGYDSATNLGGESRDTTTNHFITDAGYTLTPGSTQDLTTAHVRVPANPANTAGQVEVGVYRVDTLARIATATVTCGNPGTETVYTATFSSGQLTSGVQYCVAWRVVVDCSVMRWDTGGTVGDRNTGLTGANALADPFVKTGATVSSVWGIWVTTADAAGGGGGQLINGNLTRGLLAGSLAR